MSSLWSQVHRLAQLLRLGDMTYMVTLAVPVLGASASAASPSHHLVFAKPGIFIYIVLNTYSQFSYQIETDLLYYLGVAVISWSVRFQRPFLRHR
jgi:hypothetical protein